MSTPAGRLNLLSASIVFAVIARDGAREQITLGGLMFAGFIASALVLGWLMYPFPL